MAPSPRIVVLAAGISLVGCDRVFRLERDPVVPGDWASVAAGDRQVGERR